MRNTGDIIICPECEAQLLKVINPIEVADDRKDFYKCVVRMDGTPIREDEGVAQSLFCPWCFWYPRDVKAARTFIFPEGD